MGLINKIVSGCNMELIDYLIELLIQTVLSKKLNSFFMFLKELPKKIHGVDS